MTDSPSFDGIHRDAADKTSAMVFSPGVRYENPAKVTCPHWDAQPPIRKPPICAPNLVGIKFGRFVVLGMSADIAGSWIVRCDCGDYETRKAKAIRNPNNFGDRCTKCRNVAFERKDYEFKKYGRQIDQRTL